MITMHDAKSTSLTRVKEVKFRCAPSKKRVWALREEISHNVAMHVGESIIPTAMAIRQSSVINPEEMKDRGVKIVNVHAVLGDGCAKLIRATIGKPPFHARASQPRGKTGAVMAPAFLTINSRGAAELGGPDHEGVIEHAALF